MRKIPEKVRKELSEDKFMKNCCLFSIECNGKIEWHHNLIFGGKQSDIKETILPLCQEHHRIADRSDIKEILNFIMLNRMKEEDIVKISKAIDYKKMKTNLIKKYGIC